MTYKDQFSKQAEEYSKYRPKYPPELFSYLSSLVNEHKLAWDAATGNGQSAIGLAPFFDKVIATDASEAQLAHAEQNKKIEYRNSLAEQSELDESSVNLITVATAIHWLDTDKFYAEAKRVLKPGGVIAVWKYFNSGISPAIDEIISNYSDKILGLFWSEEVRRSWKFANEIILPFEPVNCPEFKIELKWNLRDVINCLYTWSSTQSYINATGKNPLDELYTELLKEWKDPEIKMNVILPLEIKAGRY